MTNEPWFQTRALRPRDELDPLEDVVNDLIEAPEAPDDSPARRLRFGWLRKRPPAEEDKPEPDKPPSWSAF